MIWKRCHPQEGRLRKTIHRTMRWMEVRIKCAALDTFAWVLPGDGEKWCCVSGASRLAVMKTPVELVIRTGKADDGSTSTKRSLVNTKLRCDTMPSVVIGLVSKSSILGNMRIMRKCRRKSGWRWRNRMSDRFSTVVVCANKCLAPSRHIWRFLSIDTHSFCCDETENFGRLTPTNVNWLPI